MTEDIIKVGSTEYKILKYIKTKDIDSLAEKETEAYKKMLETNKSIPFHEYLGELFGEYFGLEKGKVAEMDWKDAVELYQEFMNRNKLIPLTTRSR